MMGKSILVFGATGLLGKIAAEQFLADGYVVKALVRDPTEASNILPENIELICGDITRKETVLRAIKDTDYIHISVSGGNEPSRIFDVELQGVKNVINAAKSQNVKHITLISGMHATQDNLTHPSEKAKYLAEQELKNSGLRYTIFKPSIFMETLRNFIQTNKAMLLGNQPNPLHLIAAKDLMKNVSKCYRIGEAHNKVFYVLGNKPYLLKDAIKRYVSVLHPGMKVSIMPLWLIKPINRFFMKGRLTRVIGIMENLQEKGEKGSPQKYFPDYVEVFGVHPTTFDEWLIRRKTKQDFDKNY